MAAAISSRGSINLFDGAHGSTNSFDGGCIHFAEGKVVQLDPKQSSIEGSNIHWFFTYWFVQADQILVKGP